MNSQRSSNNCRSFNFSPCLSSTSASRWKKRKSRLNTCPEMLCSLTEWPTSSWSQIPGFLSFTHPCSFMPSSHFCNRKPAASPTATICQSAPADTGCQVFACYRRRHVQQQRQRWNFRSDQPSLESHAGCLSGSVCSQCPAVGKSFTQVRGDVMSSVRKHSAEWSTNQSVDCSFFFLFVLFSKWCGVLAHLAHHGFAH